MPNVTVIRRRKDFLASAKSGLRYSTPSVAVQVRLRDEAEAPPSTIRVGFTATKQLGGAVIRNRAKRRLRAAAAKIVPVMGRPGCDYVFLGRDGTVRHAFVDLIRDMKHALKRLADALPQTQGRSPGS